MENASKALLMSAGILIGILILALMVTLLASGIDIFSNYDQIKNAESVQQFNTNFTKYLEHDLTVHQVITIYNFAKQNGFKDSNITKPKNDFNFDSTQISDDLNEASNKLEILSGYYKVEKIYKLTIEAYDSNTGYISKIKFTQPTNKYKCYKKDASGNIIIEYNS